jgi:endonuclease YncB( thermonuclease family)
MKARAIALGAVIALSACGTATAFAPITTEPTATVAPTTTVGATTTTVTPTTTIVAPTTTTAAPTTTAVVSTTVAPTTAFAPLTVTSVVDGDTLDLSDGSIIRLIGIDTPERGQCGYGDASAVMAGLVTGFDITLVPGARDDVDKYGRLLRYVETPGVDVNLAMIESGRAIARYDGRDGYGVHPRQAAYVAADEASPSLNECGVAVVPIAAPVPTTPPPTTPAPAGVYYKNCAAVRAAGAAPIHAGEPGWQTKFDADGDGIGCE